MSALARSWVSARAALAAERARGIGVAPALDPAFLPAAIEVIERPVSPTARRTAQILLGGLAATGLWLVLGTVDVVAAAPGQTVPRAHVKLVQSAGGGVVRRIYVREGEHVRAGQPLADLDPTVAGADEAEAARALLAAELDAARGRAVVAGLSGQNATYTPPAGTPADVVATQRALVTAEIASAMAATAGLADARRAALADAQAASAQHQALAASSPMLDRQVEAIHTLAAKGYASKLRLLDMQRQQQSERGNLAAAAAQRAHALAEAERDAHELARTREEALKAALTTLANAEHEVEGRRAELAKASLRRARQRLVAPVDGTVEQLAIHTEGGVVPAVQPLMAIVPYGAMMVEARVQNRDAGVVKPGQPVAVRFEAFPYTRYGSVTGRIVSIAREAVGDGRSAGVYRAEVAIDGNATTTGQALPLRAGMAATVDIRLGARRLITYLVDPVATTLGEAARER